MNALAHQLTSSPGRTACQCGTDCSATVAITRSQMARVRAGRGALIAYAHLSPHDEVIGVADHFLVIAPGRRNESQWTSTEPAEPAAIIRERQRLMYAIDNRQ
jgi:hypothetical protein